MNKGKLIVIEGLDGSGKTTQHKRLLERLLKDKKKILGIEFPDYSKPQSTLIKMYLSGDFGKNPDDINPYGSSVLYSGERFASYKSSWEKEYLKGNIILSARYTSSNLFHQMSKLDRSLWDGFKDWLYDLEYKKMGLPEPDRVIFLDVEPELSKSLIEKRNEKKDIHELDYEYLLRCRKAALYSVENWGFININCSRNKVMKDKQEIEDLIYKNILDLV